MWPTHPSCFFRPSQSLFTMVPVPRIQAMWVIHVVSFLAALQLKKKPNRVDVPPSWDLGPDPIGKPLETLSSSTRGICACYLTNFDEVDRSSDERCQRLREEPLAQ